MSPYSNRNKTTVSDTYQGFHFEKNQYNLRRMLIFNALSISTIQKNTLFAENLRHRQVN